MKGPLDYLQPTERQRASHDAETRAYEDDTSHVEPLEARRGECLPTSDEPDSSRDKRSHQMEEARHPEGEPERRGLYRHPHRHAEDEEAARDQEDPAPEQPQPRLLKRTAFFGPARCRPERNRDTGAGATHWVGAGASPRPTPSSRAPSRGRPRFGPPACIRTRSNPSSRGDRSA